MSKLRDDPDHTHSRIPKKAGAGRQCRGYHGYMVRCQRQAEAGSRYCKECQERRERRGQ